MAYRHNIDFTFNDLHRTIFHMLHGEGTITAVSNAPNVDFADRVTVTYKNGAVELYNAFGAYLPYPGAIGQRCCELAWESWWATDLPAAPGSAVWVTYRTSNNCPMNGCKFPAIMLMQADNDGTVCVAKSNGDFIEVDREDVQPITDDAVAGGVKAACAITDGELRNLLIAAFGDFAQPWQYGPAERVQELMRSAVDGTDEDQAWAFIYALAGPMERMWIEQSDYSDLVK